MGDSADGYPGLPGWGAKTASTVLARYRHLEKIPASGADWDLTVRGAEKLAQTLRDRWKEALLFRTLATLRTDEPAVTVDDLEWRGPTARFETLATSWRRPRLAERAAAAAAAAARTRGGA